MVPTVYTLSQNLRSENDKVYKVVKGTKINSRIISKPHAHLQTMEKTCASFKKIGIKLYEELRSQGTRCLFIEVKKMTKFTKWKK